MIRAYNYKNSKPNDALRNINRSVFSTKYIFPLFSAMMICIGVLYVLMIVSTGSFALDSKIDFISKDIGIIVLGEVQHFFFISIIELFNAKEGV